MESWRNDNEKENKMNFEKNKDLTMYNSMKIKSVVEYYKKVKNREELLETIKFAKKNKIRTFFIGNGTNTLFAKKYYKNSIFIDLKGMNQIKILDGEIVAEAGVLSGNFVKFCIDNLIAGYEFLAGIPGTIGGMILMNAGAFGKEISECLNSIEILDVKKGKFLKLKKEDLKFSYRKLEGMNSGVIVEGKFKIIKGNLDKIKAKIEKLLKVRKSKQPIGFSLGSIFKNSKDYFAGELIEKAGLKGSFVGDAYVSGKHANFIINRGNASGKDVLKLIQKIEKTVFNKSGILLEREVKVFF